jgi:hypothetical protein
MLTCSLLRSDIFHPRLWAPLHLKMRPLVLSKAIKLSFVTLFQPRTWSITTCLLIASPSSFPSYSVSLVFYVRQRLNCYQLPWLTDLCVKAWLQTTILQLLKCLWTHLKFVFYCRIWYSNWFLLLNFHTGDCIAIITTLHTCVTAVTVFCCQWNCAAL